MHVGGRRDTFYSGQGALKQRGAGGREIEEAGWEGNPARPPARLPFAPMLARPPPAQQLNPPSVFPDPLGHRVQ